MRKKKLLAAVISLALVIAAALPSTLAISNGQDSGSTPTETTAPETNDKGTEIPACTCGAAEGEGHKEGCPLYTAAPAETKKTCTCGAAEGEGHKEGCPLYVTAPEETKKTCTCGVTEGEAHKEGCTLYTAAPAETKKTCTCGVAEGETHKEDCPLYAAPVDSAEAGKSAEPPAPEDGDKAPEDLKCTCEPQRGEGEPHETTCPLYEGDKHIEGCSDDCKDPECECGCHLFNKIMACTDVEAIWDLLDAATEEELKALTEEQRTRIEAKIEELEPVPETVAAEENSVEMPVQSEVVYPSKSFTYVAPFKQPVQGAGQ